MLFWREVQPITGGVLVSAQGSDGQVGIGQDAQIRSVLILAGTAPEAMCHILTSGIEPVFCALLTIGLVDWSVADKRLR